MKRKTLQQVQRKTHTIDATGKAPGRLATQIVYLLGGKGKPDFAFNLDIGDFVIVKNIKQLRFTGKKLKGKTYYRHSGYLGGLKAETLGKFFERKPGEVLRKMVLGMLPKNRLRPLQIKRLKVEI
jgi:large subunit ribosomal protein L13